MGDSWSSWSGVLRCLPWSGTSASKAWQSGSPELRIVDRKLSDCSQRRSWISVPGEWRAVHRSCTAKTSVTKNISHTYRNIYLEPVGAAGDRGEDVVAVHGAQDQLGAVPDLATVGVPALEPGAPSLQTAHTDCREVTNTTLGLYLDTDITDTCFQNNPIL